MGELHMGIFICGSLRTVDIDDSATIAIAKQIYAETVRLEIAVQLADTTYIENLPDEGIRNACVWAASKIEGNLIFNVLVNPLSNNQGDLMNDLNIWDNKDPEEAPLMKFAKWLLSSERFDSAAIFVEDGAILYEIGGILPRDPDEQYDETKCTREEFLQNLREYFPRKTEGGGQGLFIIQM